MGCLFDLSVEESGAIEFLGERIAQDAGSAAMHDALQLALPLASIKQDTRPLDMRAIVELRRSAGMIEPPGEMVDGGGAVNGLLHLRLIGDFTSHNSDGIAKLLARLPFIARKDAYWLPLFYQFSDQRGT